MARIFIWAQNILNANGELNVGGVETYLSELARVLSNIGHDVTIVAVNEKQNLDLLRIHAVPLTEWKKGVNSSRLNDALSFTPDDLHIFGDVHSVPEQLPENSIGIQHGILWDRPNTKFGFLPKAFKYLIGAWRNYKGSRIVKDFNAVVCVDLVFPTNVACTMAGLDWNRIHYIPNFAPDTEHPGDFDNAIERIVFSRRFVAHRGTQIMVEAAKRILDDGWQGEICFYGDGPMKSLIQSSLSGYKNVKLGKLDYQDRMQAFDSKTLTIVPSLSTEGTSLSLIEGWSRGSLVISTGVGGLSNLLIDRLNGLLIKPTAEDLYQKMNSVIQGEVDIQGMKKRGYESFQVAFNESLWAERWQSVISQYTR